MRGSSSGGPPDAPAPGGRHAVFEGNHKLFVGEAWLLVAGLALFGLGFEMPSVGRRDRSIRNRRWPLPPKKSSEPFPRCPGVSGNAWPKNERGRITEEERRRGQVGQHPFVQIASETFRVGKTVHVKPRPRAASRKPLRQQSPRSPTQGLEIGRAKKRARKAREGPPTVRVSERQGRALPWTARPAFTLKVRQIHHYRPCRV